MNRIFVILACALACACTSARTGKAPSPASQSVTGEEMFFSDSLNAMGRYRTYPAPNVEPTRAPKGYKPVYISSYARHGSRKMLSLSTAGNPAAILAYADSIGCLTPLGREVCEKLVIIRNDMERSLGDLTRIGVRQHAGIAERMCRDYPSVFAGKEVEVRLYSTVTQRTMHSMFACNEALLKHNRFLSCIRTASDSLSCLTAKYDNPEGFGKGGSLQFIRDYFDPQPLLDRLFTGNVPVLKDTVKFVENLYNSSIIVLGEGLFDADFIWDLFTWDELFTLQQAQSYDLYLTWSNSPELGARILSSIKPLLRDFMDKADAALEKDVPGADLRFGHDIYLMPLLALIGVNGYVTPEEDPLKVIDTFQDFNSIPMAANLQLVFFRNGSGDVLVKFLKNEVEAWIPLETDMYPYYHWNDVREYFKSLI
ncbi:MAG: histidine phosphatase family protein [Clostridia bacterium]|nr:histidine phosphatase family protein [Clostridia bacterium]